MILWAEKAFKRIIALFSRSLFNLGIFGYFLDGGEEDYNSLVVLKGLKIRWGEERIYFSKLLFHKIFIK